MKQLYIDIKARLVSQVTELKFIALYNNQFQRNNEGKNFSFPHPAALIEFVNPIARQLGNGTQIYEPLQVRVHLANFILNTPGSQDENLQIFDLKQKVYAALTKFHPNYSSPFIRSEESPPYNHDMVAIYPINFITAYFDESSSEPINSVPSIPPTELILNVTT